MNAPPVPCIVVDDGVTMCDHLPCLATADQIELEANAPPTEEATP